MLTPWLTRYLYDLTQGGTVAFNGSPYYAAYGNLYATQELLPNGGTSQTYTGAPIANATFQPLTGTQYDALDRAVGGYRIVNGANALATTTFDHPGEYGLVSQQCQPPIPGHTLCKNFAYDNDSRVTSIAYSDPSSSTRSFTYDPDGRTLSAANADGTQSSWYDSEGRIVNTKEPTHGTSPATYTHEFYADGKLKQLDLASNALAANGLFVYSYTNQGLSGHTTITDPPAVNVTVTYGYTPAGRIASRSESGSGANGNPTSWSYDAYGQLRGVTYPQQPPIQNYTYDPEGDLLSFGTPGQGVSQSFSYTMRGEALPATLPGGNPLFGNPGTYAMANGAQVQTATGTGIVSYSATWDDRMGVMTAMTINPTTFPLTQTSFSYDAAGRETGNGSSNCSDASCDTHTASGASRTYDVDNQTLDTQQWWSYTKGQSSGAAANVSVYDWGPNDHPIRIGSADSSTSTPPPDSAATYDTLHWDGNQLVFTTTSTGVVDDIKVGSSGDITPTDSGYSGITFWDRGPGGAVVYCHNASGSGGSGQIPVLPMFMAWSSSPCAAFNQPPSGSFPSSMLWFTGLGTFGAYSGHPRAGGVGQGKIVGMYRTDGLSDGANTIQGVRTTDAMSGTWTTPDAFAGVVGDPSSQKAYMWNGNNPLAYSDPTGYAIGGSAFAGGLDSGTWVTNCSNCSLIATDDGSSDTSQGSGNPTLQQAYLAVQATPYSSGDYGLRESDQNAVEWAEQNYNEAQTESQQYPGYEIGANMDASNGFKVGPTYGGGNGNDVNIPTSPGDAIVHSHGHYYGSSDFGQHVDLLKSGTSAVYTLAEGKLYVQWVSPDNVIHGAPEVIYNIRAAMGEGGF